MAYVTKLPWQPSTFRVQEVKTYVYTLNAKVLVPCNDSGFDNCSPGAKY